MAKMWMVRGNGGRLYDDFRGNGMAALGTGELVAADADSIVSIVAEINALAA